MQKNKWIGKFSSIMGISLIALGVVVACSTKKESEPPVSSPEPEVSLEDQFKQNMAGTYTANNTASINSGTAFSMDFSEGTVLVDVPTDPSTTPWSFDLSLSSSSSVTNIFFAEGTSSGTSQTLVVHSPTNATLDKILVRAIDGGGITVMGTVELLIDMDTKTLYYDSTEIATKD